MAKTLAQFKTDIHGYLGKGKVKQARRTLDKAAKTLRNPAEVAAG